MAVPGLPGGSRAAPISARQMERVGHLTGLDHRVAGECEVTIAIATGEVNGDLPKRATAHGLGVLL